MFKRFDESRHPCWTNHCLEPVYCTAVEEYNIIGLVIEVFDDPDKVITDFVLLHGCLQSCMPKCVEGLLEVCEDL